MLAPWKKIYYQPRQHIKKQEHYFVNKGPSSQSYGISSSHVWMWELDHKKAECWRIWCFWTVVFRTLLRVPWAARRSNQSILEEISPEYTLEKLMLKPQYIVPPDAKNWLIRKDPDARKDWRQKEKGTTEDEMVGWHHRLNGHEFEEALRVGDGQGSLVCCSPWRHKESDRIEWVNWTQQKWNQPVPLPPRALWQPPCRYPLTNHFCHSLSTAETALRASMSCLRTLPDLAILSCVRGYDLHLPASTFLSLGLSLLDCVHYPLSISVE